MNNEPILCTAHRGIWDETTPQNTVEAIAKAYAAGAEWVETDFNEEPDGAILCYHDNGVRAKIKPPFKVPTLAEVMALVPSDGGLQCEIKKYGPTYAEKFNAAVRDAGLGPENITVSSFNAEALADFHRRHPDYKAILLFCAGTEGPDKQIDIAHREGFWSLCPGCETLRGKWKPEDAEKIRAAGFDFRVWGVNSPESLALAAEFGAAAFTCNFYETAFDWARQLNIALRPKIAR